MEKFYKKHKRLIIPAVVGYILGAILRGWGLLILGMLVLIYVYYQKQKVKKRDEKPDALGQ